MDTTGVIAAFVVALELSNVAAKALYRAFSLVKLYGGGGIALWLFGNRSTWRLEAQVLGKLNDQDAFAFKSVVQGQSTMIAVAVSTGTSCWYFNNIRAYHQQAAIVAQISVTAISLSKLSQTHWVASGFLNFSLVSALMGVYYASTQYRVLGRLLQAEQIRLWIRGGRLHRFSTERIIPSLPQLFTLLPVTKSPWLRRVGRILYFGIFGTILAVAQRGWSGLIDYLDEEIIQPCDPTSFIPGQTAPQYLNAKFRANCFTPAVSAVVTMSAGPALLTASLFSLLISLGIYLSFTWTRGLNEDAGADDSRNIFIMYTLSLVLGLVVYSLSLLIQEEDVHGEKAILNQYVADYVHANQTTVNRWGYDWSIQDGAVHFRHRGSTVPHPTGGTAAANTTGGTPHSSHSSGIGSQQQGVIRPQTPNAANPHGGPLHSSHSSSTGSQQQGVTRPQTPNPANTPGNIV
jgi:hypothetical protein